MIYKQKTSKVKKAQTKQYETLKKITKITTEFILCWPYAAGLAASPYVWFEYLVRLHWRN